LGGDVRTGKRTLMVAHALGESGDAKRLLDILDCPAEDTTDADVDEAIRILHDAGSIRFAEEAADGYVSEAKAGLTALPETPGGEALTALAEVADYVLNREK
jgi:geranylgeranyl diphosphate synthase, type I